MNVILATLFFLSTPAAPPPDAVAVVTAIYKNAAAGKGDSGGQFLWLDPKVRPRAFSKSLVALWAKADKATPEGDEGPIDFDPVTNSQDPGLKSFRVASEKQTAAAATVAVTMVDTIGQRSNRADDVVRYDMVLEDGRWKIDDIRGAIDGKPWSLRGILAESLKLSAK